MRSPMSQLPCSRSKAFLGSEPGRTDYKLATNGTKGMPCLMHTLSTPRRYASKHTHASKYTLKNTTCPVSCTCSHAHAAKYYALKETMTPYLMHTLLAAVRPSSKQAHTHCSRVWPFWPCWSLCDMVKGITRMSDSRPPCHQAIESGLLAMALFTQTV